MDSSDSDITKILSSKVPFDNKENIAPKKAMQNSLEQTATRTPLRQSNEPNKRGSMTTPHHKTSIAGIFATATVRKSRAVGVDDTPSLASTASTAGNEFRVARALASEMAASNDTHDDATSAAVAAAANVASENANQPNSTLVELLELKQQLEAAKTRNSQHEQKIATLNEKYVAAHENATRLRNELDESHRSSNLLYHEFLTNKMELKQAIEQCKQLREQAASTSQASPISSSVESSSQQLADARVALATAEAAAETARRSCEAAEKCADAACDESNRLQSELTAQRSLYATLEQRNADLKTQYTAATRDAEAAATAAAAALQSNNELQKQNEALHGELNSLRSALSESQSATQQAEQATSALQRELAEVVERTRRSMDAERAELTASLNQAQLTITSLKQQQPQSTSTTTTTSSSPSSSSASASSSTATSSSTPNPQQRSSSIEQELDAANALLSTQLTEARTALIAAKATASNASAEQAELARALQLRSHDADALRAANLALEQELSALRLKSSSELNADAYKSLHASLLHERDLLRQQLDSAMALSGRIARVAALENGLSVELNRVANNVTSRINVIRQNGTAAQQCAASATAHAAQLEERIATMTSEHTTQLATLNAQIAALRNELSGALADAASLRSELCAERSAAASLRDRLASTSAELAQLTTRESNTAERLADATSTLAKLRTEQQELAEFVEEERQIRQDEFAKLDEAARTATAALNEARAQTAALQASTAAREATLIAQHAVELQTARDALLVLRFDAVQASESNALAVASAEAHAKLADELRANADARADSLQAELEDAHAQLDEARTEAALADERLVQLTTRHADALVALRAEHAAHAERAQCERDADAEHAHASLAAASLRVAHLERAVALHDAALADANRLRIVADERAQTAEELRAAQAERLAFLEAERDAHLTTHTQIVGPLNETIVTQRMALDDLERRAVAAEQQVAQLSAAYSEARANRDAMRERAEAEIRRLRQRDSDNAAALAHVDAQLSLKTSEVEEANDELATLRETARQTEQQVADLTSELQLLARENEQLAVHLDMLLDNANEHADPAYAERLHRYADAMALERQVTRLTGQCDAAQATVAAVKKDFDNLRNYTVGYKKKAASAINQLTRNVRKLEVDIEVFQTSVGSAATLAHELRNSASAPTASLIDRLSQLLSPAVALLPMSSANASTSSSASSATSATTNSSTSSATSN